MSDEVKPWYGSGVGRGEGGRFNGQWRGGPGNPNNKRTYELRKAILECTTPQQVTEVIGSLFRAATADPPDVQAGKAFLEYTVGKPSQVIEISGQDGDPLQVQTADLTAVTLSALADFPEAKIAVAARLRGLSSQASPPALEAQPGGPVNGPEN